MSEAMQCRAELTCAIATRLAFVFVRVIRAYASHSSFIVISRLLAANQTIRAIYMTGLTARTSVVTQANNEKHGVWSRHCYQTPKEVLDLHDEAKKINEGSKTEKTRKLKALAWSPNAEMLAIGWDNGELSILCSDHGPRASKDKKELTQLEGAHKASQSVTALAFGDLQSPHPPEARLLVSGGEDMTVRCFLVKYYGGQDGPSQIEAQPLFKTIDASYYTHDKQVSCVSLAHGSALLASASDDGLFKLVDVGETSLSEMRDVKTETNEAAVSALAFAHDGSSLAAGTQKGTLHFYELGTWEMNTNLTAPEAKESEAKEASVCAFVQAAVERRGGGEQFGAMQVAMGYRNGVLELQDPIVASKRSRRCQLPGAMCVNGIPTRPALASRP